MKYPAMLLSLCLLLGGCSYYKQGGQPASEEESIFEQSFFPEEPSAYIEPESSSAIENIEESPESSAAEPAEPAPEAVESPGKAEAAPGTAVPSSRAEASGAAETPGKAVLPGSTASSAAQSVSPVSSSPAGSGSRGTESLTISGYAAIEREILTLINGERRALGLGELQYDSSLAAASLVRSGEMYRTGSFSHTRPNGTNWNTVLLADVPVAYVAAGENLGRIEHNRKDYDASVDAAYWFAGWKNSPGHYENIIRKEFTHMGAGIYRVQRADGMIVAYATTLFASYA